MTLVIKKPTSGKLVLSKVFSYDTDAATYITAVEAADGQALETSTRYAINNFVIGCKQDGIWSAIKASCILAGARTLAGALVPLVGTAPTNNNFVGSDYSRKTGLIGNGSSKYLDTNRLNSIDPQNSNHYACYLTSGNTSNTAILSSYSDAAGRNYLDYRIQNRGVLSAITAVLTTDVGLIGTSRASASSFNIRRSGSSYVDSGASSQTPDNGSITIYCRRTSAGVTSYFSNARIGFYSIGEAIDLQKLDARVTDLINAIGAAF